MCIQKIKPTFYITQTHEQSQNSFFMKNTEGGTRNSYFQMCGIWCECCFSLKNKRNAECAVQKHHKTRKAERNYSYNFHVLNKLLGNDSLLGLQQQKFYSMVQIYEILRIILFQSTLHTFSYYFRKAKKIFKKCKRGMRNSAESCYPVTCECNDI